MKWFRKAAEQGHAEAQNNLSGRYALGQGAELDGNDAVKWFRKAAEQGLAQAETRLGQLYVIGDVVDQDYTEAFKWFYKAAERGYSQAQYDLGLMYFNGEGVQKDYIQAYACAKLAKSDGMVKSPNFIDVLLLSMTDEKYAKAQALAKEWGTMYQVQ